VLTRVLLSLDATAMGEPQIRIRGGDLTCFVETAMPLASPFHSSAGPREVLLDPVRLRQILAGHNGDSVHIQIADAGSMVEIDAGRSKFKLNTEDASIYPKMEKCNNLPIQLPASQLETLIRRTHKVCDADSTRYALGSICFEPTEAGLQATSTDGRRMVRETVAVTSAGEFGRCLMPQGFARKLLPLLKTVESSGAYLSVEGESSLMVRSLGWTAWARQQEGRFPNTSSIWSAQIGPVLCRVPAGQLCQLASQSRIVASFESRGVVMELTADGLVMTGESEAGKARVEQSVDRPSGGSADLQPFIVDPAYILDAADCLPPDEPVDIRFVSLSPDTRSRSLFIGAGTYKHILQPILKE
jgi:DNA polymerase III sliding clamp (beta) subunit (PCNA family)